MPSRQLAARVGAFRESVFSEFRALAEKHRAIPLSSGEPDFAPPDEILVAVERAMRDGFNRYALPGGLMPVRQAIADHIERFRGGTTVDPLSIAVTCGAYEALLSAFLTVADVGSEIITFEPFFDVYQANAALVGATLTTVLLRPPDGTHTTWWFEPDELRAAFTPRTAAIIVNTPHNPTGKVFTVAELELISELAQQHDITVITDEVYEHIVFPPAKHIRPANIDGLAERTISIGSASKTFGVAGWRVGWMHAPLRLIKPAVNAHAAATWCAPTPFQLGVAAALSLPDAFFAELAAKYQRLRARMAEILAIGGIQMLQPEGTFFALSDISQFGFADDRVFTRYLIEEGGIAAIPASGLYSYARAAEASRLVRFAFCRHDHFMDDAHERMTALRPKLLARTTR